MRLKWLSHEPFPEQDGTSQNYSTILSSVAGKDYSDRSLSKLHSLCVTLCAVTFAEKYISPNLAPPSLLEINAYHTSLKKWFLHDSLEPLSYVRRL